MFLKRTLADRLFEIRNDESKVLTWGEVREKAACCETRYMRGNCKAFECF